MKSIVLVSPEIQEVKGSGGVGTFVKHLSMICSKDFKVSILATDQNVGRKIQNVYLDRNISILQDTLIQQSTSDRYKQSVLIYERLRHSDFDHAIFSDWGGAAHETLKQRATLSKLGITVVAHGCTDWAYQGLGQFLSQTNPIQHAKNVLAEQYGMRNADNLVSPSIYMDTWVRDYLQLPGSGNQKVLRQPFVPTNISNDQIESNLPDSISMFGRLEERKGISLFIDSLFDLSKRMKLPPIYFFGKPGWMSTGELGDAYIRRRFTNELPFVSFHIYTDKNSQECLELMRQSNSLLVIPSFLDNAPYTVIEALNSGLRFICSEVGGIKEYAPAMATFNLNSRSLTLKIEDALTSKRWETKPYDSNSANSQWISFLRG